MQPVSPHSKTNPGPEALILPSENHPTDSAMAEPPGDEEEEVHSPLDLGMQADSHVQLECKSLLGSGSLTLQL